MDMQRPPTSRDKTYGIALSAESYNAWTSLAAKLGVSKKRLLDTLAKVPTEKLEELFLNEESNAAKRQLEKIQAKMSTIAYSTTQDNQLPRENISGEVGTVG